MYQNYVFDFYGTLADICTDEEDPELWRRMSEIYGAMGASYSPEELKREFRLLEQEELRRLGFPDGEPDLRRVFGSLYLQRGVSCEPGQIRLTAITFRALSRRFLRVYDGVREFLQELQKRGRGIYLLSNAQTDFTRPEIAMLGLTSYFDGIFLSSEQGCKKPSPLFFRKFLEAYRLDPSGCIMIGNDEQADIAGAGRMGMDTLYIHTSISPRQYGGVPATYRILDGDFRRVSRLLL